MREFKDGKNIKARNMQSIVSKQTDSYVSTQYTDNRSLSFE